MESEGPEAQEGPQSGVIGERKRLNGKIHLEPYNPDWPGMFSDLAARVRAALPNRVLMLEHVGSTSIKGLSAKPIIDILLVVEDSRRESDYVQPLESQGFTLRRREPEWFEHRLFRHAEIKSNLHVFSQDCTEIDRMLAFRDWLRANPEDRLLYEAAKRELAAKHWAYGQDYADAKTEVVRAILDRSLGRSNTKA